MLQFIFNDLKNNYKLSLAYSLILVLLTSIEYVFFELINYPDVLYYGGTMFAFMSLLVIGLLFVMTFYLNTFYIEEKRSQIVFLSLSGASLFKLGMFLLIQYFIMLIVSMSLAMILGRLLFYFIIQYASTVVAIEGTIIYSFDGLVEMVGIEISKCIIMVMINVAFIYKNEISEIINKVDIKRNNSLKDSIKKSFSTTGSMMGVGMSMMRGEDIQQATNTQELNEILKKKREANQAATQKILMDNPSIKEVRKDRLEKYRPFFPLLFYVIGLVVIMFSQNVYISCIMILVIGFSIFSFIKTSIYKIFERLEEQKLYEDPCSYVVCHEVLHRLNSNQIILIIMNIALPFFIFQATTRATLFVEILACFSFIVLLFVLMVLLLLKNYLDIQHGISNYRILYVLGYNKEDLMKISNRANFFNYLISVGLSLFAIMIFTIKMMYSTWGLCLLISIIIIVSFFVSVGIVKYYNRILIRRIQ
ncbi:MAG: hypothetical protein ACLRVU_11405 [Beduini sp.]|uniref:hypothetical protein n=1 Tax=Beduini sp. TaxID=1922300 RepID=UPI00399F185E